MQSIIFFSKRICLIIVGISLNIKNGIQTLCSHLNVFVNNKQLWYPIFPNFPLLLSKVSKDKICFFISQVTRSKLLHTSIHGFIVCSQFKKHLLFSLSKISFSYAQNINSSIFQNKELKGGKIYYLNADFKRESRRY